MQNLPGTVPPYRGFFMSDSLNKIESIEFLVSVKKNSIFAIDALNCL